MNALLKATLILGLVAAVTVPVYAGTVTVSFTEPALSLLPGQTDVVVTATLTNTDPLNPVFLNGDSLSVPGATAINDEFFINVPFSLDPGQTSAPIELFRFDVAANAPAGTLTGSYDLQGGAGTANQFNFDPVASGTFTVSIQAVPEPSQCLLLGCGLIALSLIARRRAARGDAR